MDDSTLTDVLLCTGHPSLDPRDAVDRDELRSFRHERLYLSRSPDIWVGYYADTAQIMKACEPAGDLGARQFGTRYAIVNEQPSDGPKFFNWDPDQRLTQFVVFSRLVQPNALGFEYAARIISCPGGKTRFHPRIGGARAYGHRGRDWLTRSEWEHTRQLVETYRHTNGSNCKRLRSVIWYHEKMAQEYYPQVRWPLLVTAMESLIAPWNCLDEQGRRVGSTKKFVHGVLKLASECKQDNVTQAEAEEVWKCRSSLVHGAGWPQGAVQNDVATSKLHERMEDLLNATIRRLIEDLEFRAVLEDDSTLAKWLGYCVDSASGA